MRATSRRTAALAVSAALLVLLVGGCTTGEDATGTGGPTSTLGADAIVLLKPDATDLQALDLRDKLIPLPGVAGVVYDQSIKRLRVDFTDTATAAEKSAARDTAAADPAVQRVRVEGEDDRVEQPPAPTAS